MNAYFVDTKKTQEEEEADIKKDEMKIKKGDLRNIAKHYGDNCVVEIAQGINSGNT